jgi:hypothetical protein
LPGHVLLPRLCFYRNLSVRHDLAPFESDDSFAPVIF